MAKKQTAESVGAPTGNEVGEAAPPRRVQGGATNELDRIGNTLRNAGLKDNNNTTSPSANQTDPWYDRPRAPRDTSSHAAQRDPKRKTGQPQDVGGVRDGKHGKNKPKVGNV